MVVGVVAGAVVLALIFIVVVFKLMWRVAEPNEALIISGSKHRTEGLEEGMGFRIVTGRGTLVLPGVQAVRKISLDLNETELHVDCVTHQGIPLKVRGVVIFKVGDDFVSIANAGRRFLDQQKMMAERVHNVFAGHLRSIVGGLTVEDMIRDREKLTGQTRAACGTEMEKLGLIVDSLQIHEIEDPTGYIKNLAMPHAAAVQRDARIAQAEANRLATEAEQKSFARMSEATRDSEILQAGYQAERDKAAAKARQAGPLADAAARQDVVVQETRIAELDALRREQQLQADVRKPADARAYEIRAHAEAERDARISAAQAKAQETELAAAAEANRVKTAANAEAEATKARVRPRRRRPAPPVRPRPPPHRPRVWRPPRRRVRRVWRRPRPSRRGPPPSPRTRRPWSPSNSRRTGRRSSRRARARSATSTTWCCSTAPTAWRTCSPRRSPWAAPAWAWHASCSRR